MRISECKPGMLVRARRDIDHGYWATGLILGRIEHINDELDLSVRFITHAIHKEYEGNRYHCKARHLVLVSKDREAGLNDNLTTLFDE